MYHERRLDTPPPQSQFRRPWSPEPFDPRPSQLPYSLPGQFPGPDFNDSYDRPYNNERRREASKSSIEALDLADYAMTLRRHDYNDEYNLSSPYPPIGSSNLGQSHASLQTLRSSPSLVSKATTNKTRSSRSPLRTPQHRPFSLPPAHVVDSPYLNTYTPHNLDRPTYPPFLDRHAAPNVDDYPEWSRPWFGQDKASSLSKPLASSFDPESSLSIPRELAPKPSSSRSQATLFPWSGQDDDDAGVRVTDEMKQERLNMLEREFGQADDTTQKADRIIGSVDEKGKLVTAGPKRRIFVRTAEFTFVSGLLVASLYSALLLKPLEPPPPRGKLPAIIIYGLSVVTTLSLLYMFVVKPCCFPAKRPKAPHEGPAGLAVLPVQGLPTGKKKPKKGKDKRGKHQGHPYDSVQVNLIVDPTAFGFGQDTGDQEEGGAVTRQGRQRRSIFQGLHLEEQWKRARGQLKLFTWIDAVLMVLWGAEFVFILLGKRCPTGTFQGWCDGYNVATALALFLCLSFGFSLFFDTMDLHASRVSPRTRP